jgi:hypothetical protein
MLKTSALVAWAAMAALAMSGCSSLKIKSTGSPLGLSALAGDQVATLTSTLVPYIPSLNRDHSKDTYRIGLLLHPLRGGRPRHILVREPSTPGVPAHARILGVDGNLVWLLVEEIAAFDLKANKLITAGDLARANPSLGGVWNNARYEFKKHLRLASRENQRSFEIDPVTLKASPASNVSPFAGMLPPSHDARASLCSGGLLSPTEWFGVLSASELASSYGPGTRLGNNNAKLSKEHRKIYRGRIERDSVFPVIGSMTPLQDQGYLDGALVRDASGSEPLRLADGFLLTYMTKPLFAGTRMVARVDPKGKVLWAADTGIADLTQILPSGHASVFIGNRPRVPDKVQEPILVIVDHESGALTVYSLWTAGS